LLLTTVLLSTSCSDSSQVDEFQAQVETIAEMPTTSISTTTENLGTINLKEKSPSSDMVTTSRTSQCLLPWNEVGPKEVVWETYSIFPYYGYPWVVRPTENTEECSKEIEKTVKSFMESLRADPYLSHADFDSNKILGYYSLTEFIECSGEYGSCLYELARGVLAQEISACPKAGHISIPDQYFENCVSDVIENFIFVLQVACPVSSKSGTPGIHVQVDIESVIDLWNKRKESFLIFDIDGNAWSSNSKRNYWKKNGNALWFFAGDLCPSQYDRAMEILNATERWK